MALVDAWDKQTGKRVPHLVPEEHIGHKFLGPNLVPTPPKKRVVKPEKSAGEAAKPEGGKSDER